MGWARIRAEVSIAIYLFSGIVRTTTVSILHGVFFLSSATASTFPSASAFFRLSPSPLQLLSSAVRLHFAFPPLSFPRFASSVSLLPLPFPPPASLAPVVPLLLYDSSQLLPFLFYSFPSLLPSLASPARFFVFSFFFLRPLFSLFFF